MATATHAAGQRVVIMEIEVGKNLKDIRKGSFDTVKPKGRLENVDDVLHY